MNNYLQRNVSTGTAEEMFQRQRDERQASLKNKYLVSTKVTGQMENAATIVGPSARAINEDLGGLERQNREESDTDARNAGDEATAAGLSSIKKQMRRSQQKQDALLQEMLDRPAAGAKNDRPQRQTTRDSVVRNKYLRTENAVKTTGAEEQVGALLSYQESEISEIRMFNKLTEDEANPSIILPEQDGHRKALQNPYLKQPAAQEAQQKNGGGSGGQAVGESDKRDGSEQRDVTPVDPTVRQDVGQDEPASIQITSTSMTMQTGIYRSRRGQQRTVEQTSSTLVTGKQAPNSDLMLEGPVVSDVSKIREEADEERDSSRRQNHSRQESVGASSSGIRPYAKERRGSARRRPTDSAKKEVNASVAQHILAQAPAVDHVDEDSFALDIQRIPGSSAKKQSMRSNFAASTPDQDESFQFNMKTVEEGRLEAEADGRPKREHLAAFGQSPITHGVRSSMDYSPESTFGFEMQAVGHGQSTSKKQSGHEGALKIADQDVRQKSFTNSNLKSVQEETADQIQRQPLPSFEAPADQERGRYSAKGGRARDPVAPQILRDDRHQRDATRQSSSRSPNPEDTLDQRLSRKREELRQKEERWRAKEDDLTDAIAEVSILPPNNLSQDSSQEQSSKQEAAYALQNSRSQLAQFANEMLSGPSNVQSRASKSSNNRFKNQYLSSHGSLVSTQKQDQDHPDDDRHAAASESKRLSHSLSHDENVAGLATSAKPGMPSAQGATSKPSNPSTSNYGSNPYLSQPSGTKSGQQYGQRQEEPEAPQVGRTKPKNAYQDVDAAAANAFQHKKQSAPVANKKLSSTGREYNYSHVKSKLAPAARQRRLRGSKKNAMPSRTMYVVEPSQSADDGEEDEDMVEMRLSNLQNSYIERRSTDYSRTVTNANKSIESRYALNAAIGTERQPNSKGTQRTNDKTIQQYLGLDNSSNKNTAKNTDGSASEAQFGFTGRGASGVGAFQAAGKGFGKKSSAIHKTERAGKQKRGSNRRTPHDPQDGRPRDDQDHDLSNATNSTGHGRPYKQKSQETRAVPSSAQKQSKSASYLNMTSSFRNKVGGAPHKTVIVQKQSQIQPTPLDVSRRHPDSMSESSRFRNSWLNPTRPHTGLQGKEDAKGDKLSSFKEQNPRTAGQGGGRQPTQKKNANRSPQSQPKPQAAGQGNAQGTDGQLRTSNAGNSAAPREDYASFGQGRSGQVQKAPNTSKTLTLAPADALAKINEAAAAGGRSASKLTDRGVFDRLSARSGADSHCQERHPERSGGSRDLSQRSGYGAGPRNQQHTAVNIKINTRNTNAVADAASYRNDYADAEDAEGFSIKMIRMREGAAAKTITSSTITRNIRLTTSSSQPKHAQR